MRNHKKAVRAVTTPRNSIPLRRRLLAFWTDVRWPLIGLLALISLALGMQGFMIYHRSIGTQYNLLDAFYQSIQLFGMESVEAQPLGVMPWQLQVTRLLSPLIAAIAVVQALALVFQQQMERLRLYFLRDHIVLCGLGRRGLLLTRTFQSEGRQVVVIEQDAANPMLGTCREYGAITLVGDARDPLILIKAGILRARYLFTASGDDGTNAEIAVQAWRLVQNTPGPQLLCRTHIYDRLLWTLLRENEFNGKTGPRFRLEFFNTFDMGARMLLREYPPFPPKPVDFMPIPGLLIIGLGHLGESIAILAGQQWHTHFLKTGARLRIEVVDPFADAKVAALLTQYPLLDTVCEFVRHSIDTYSPEFYAGRFLMDAEGNSSITHAYICMDDSAVALSAGLALLGHLRSQPVKILVRMSEDSGLASLITTTRGMEESESQLLAFGLIDRTCRPGILEDGTHETLARVIHEEYLHEMELLGLTHDPVDRPAILPWEKLDERYRQSNLNQALEIGKKLNAIGCGLAPWTAFDAEEFTFTDEEIEKMAHLEHIRWVDERLSWGWRYAPQRDNRAMTHPDLLDWDDPLFTTQEKDRQTVRKIPYFLARAGFQVYRMRSVKQARTITK